MSRGVEHGAGKAGGQPARQRPSRCEPRSGFPTSSLSPTAEDHKAALASLYGPPNLHMTGVPAWRRVLPWFVEEGSRPHQTDER